MPKELDDATEAATASSSEERGREDVFSETERDTLRRGELVFPKEADTLTMDVPGALMADDQDGSTAIVLRETDLLPRAVPPPLPKKPASVAPSVEEANVVADEWDDRTETTPPEARPEPEDPTSPTLSLANRSDTSREVYRLFLASEYAPALDLANELIARGDDDPMLITIARECRMALAGERRASSAPPSLIRDDRPGPLAGVTGATTLAEVASMMGVSLDQVVRVLERFVATSALDVRPPAR